MTVLPSNHAGVVNAPTPSSPPRPARPFLPNGQPVPEILTTNQVAAIAHVTIRTVRYWVEAGHLTPRRRGGKGRGYQHEFDGAQVVAFLRRPAGRRGGGR